MWSAFQNKIVGATKTISRRLLLGASSQDFYRLPRAQIIAKRRAPHLFDLDQRRRYGGSLHRETAEDCRPPDVVRHGTRDVHGWKMPPIWYVTFEVRAGGELPKRRSPRLTTTFETEAEARDFARAKLQEGLIVFAGTINPYVPRKLIPSHDIATWVTEENEE